MLRQPNFWSHGAGGVTALLLSPASWVVSLVSTRRARADGQVAGVPVFCCGNATVGGAGKTILALDLLERLRRRGLRPHAISRGHGGRRHRSAAIRVDPGLHDAAVVGDEALLLARVAPCWVSADRVQAARLAIADGADVLVMDDGLQNFGLHKDCAILVVDGRTGFGNGFVLPAGPLREPPMQALARCRAMVLIGDDRTGLYPRLRGHRPILRASLRLGPEIEQLRGRKLVAFAGIGRPGKFFDSLRQAGVEPAQCVAFPDHHRYRPHDLKRLLARRNRLGSEAVLATTGKDAVRLPAWFRSQTVVVGVDLVWSDERIERVIDAVLWQDAGQ